MKLFLDFLPIVVFFGAYKFFNLYVATVLAILASILQLGITTLILKKRPDMMQIITLIMIIILGGATVFFKNELFIKWKPTVVYWLLGSAFALAPLWGKNLVKTMLEKSLTLPGAAWYTLNFIWAGFFLVMGVINLLVAYNFDTNTWVNFKLFGTLGLTVVFVIIQGILISKWLPKQSINNQPQ